MPKVSRTSATGGQSVEGMVDDRSEELGGYLIGFTSFACDIDGAPLMRGLPADQCQCPHWGYVFSGAVTCDYGDREETYRAGDAFYMTPGHVPTAEAGSEFVLFSPKDQLAATEAAIHAHMRSLQQA